MSNAIEGHKAINKQYFNVDYNDYSDDDEEDECRVCRGPAEEGRPLFSPCKCSGSIAMVHQDCLRSWLEVTRGVKCELCSTPFQFAPKYADNTPDQLPAYEIIGGVMLRASSKWFPLFVRGTAALILWIFVFPLSTAYLYYAWLHGPSAMVNRWKFELTISDTISGGVIAGFIVVTFLSMMSFADFLRFHYQRANENRVNANIAAAAAGINIEDEKEEEGADIIMPFHAAGVPDVDDLAPGRNLGIQRVDPVRERLEDAQMNDNDRMNQDIRNIRQLRENHPPMRLDENNRFEPRFEPMEPVVGEDDGIDIHVALDELIGLRGPIVGLVRNLLWLITFNTAYIGVFVCLPYAIGIRFFSALSLSRFASYVLEILPTFKIDGFTLPYMVSFLNEESAKKSAILQLPDICHVLLGYFFISVLIFVWHGIVSTAHYLQNLQGNSHDQIPMGFGYNDEGFGNHGNGERREARNLNVVIEGASAIMKVCSLLFLKMFLLPMILGFFLNASTLALFDASMNDRILYAGSDLFGSLLTHWVSGITFMLIVTVSVLQLREVVHPDILAKVIRPQEPQPDLLGNLLNESGFTHAKRMVLSLVIYVGLLAVYVWIPGQILLKLGVEAHLPFFRQRMWLHFLPQLQVPLELLIFHLCMLGFLEKFKNNIGRFQYYFLLRACNFLDISEYIIPHSIEKFALVCVRPVYVDANEGTRGILSQTQKKEGTLRNKLNPVHLDPFWKDLSESADSEVICLSESKEILDAFEVGFAKNNGQIALSHQNYIRISSENPGESNILVPTSVGPYRLRHQTQMMHSPSYMKRSDYDPKIEIWREVPGLPLLRPPDGWDDLGIGGAEVQKRWAWGDETKSDVEASIASRYQFKMHPNKIMLALKLFMLILSFWVVEVLLLCVATNLPLWLGRNIFYLLFVSEEHIHDPLSFSIGAGIMYGFGHFMNTISGNFSTVLEEWYGEFTLPYGTAKIRTVLVTLTLWFAVIPSLVGTLFNLCLVTNKQWWAEMDILTILYESVNIWLAGLILFNMWVYFCYIGIMTKRFWSRVGEAVFVNQRQNENDGARNVANEDEGPADDEDNDLVFQQQWQGKDGKIHAFFQTLKLVLGKWEWDKVDSDILLYDCVYPIVRHLVLTLILPLIGLFGILQLERIANIFGITHESVGLYLWESGLNNMIIYRSFAFVMSTIQLGIMFEEPLKIWLDSAQKAARDEKYLVGETLLNYNQF